MLEVLHDDAHVLVLNKPAPLLTQAPAGVPSLEALAKAYIKEKYSKPAGVYLGVPHRLDRPVTGVVCFARNTRAAQKLHAQFADRTATKVYWAMVRGVPTPTAGEWRDWMRKLAEESRTAPAGPGEPGAREGVLAYRVLRELPGGCLLELRPKTGRMHQLRAQAAWRGHPVWGDVQYGSDVPFGPGAEASRERVIALHARRLTLLHPRRDEEVSWEAPPPAAWGLPADVESATPLGDAATLPGA